MISYGLNEAKKERVKTEQLIPKFELSTNHYKNLKAIRDRLDLIAKMPKNAVVAEIGVYKGDFSKIILDTSSPFKLHLIDVWTGNQYPSYLYEEVKTRFHREIQRKQVEINRGLSIDVVNNFPDNYFDWIYLDTVHSYNYTINELQSFLPKMKKNGIIAGHDYIVGNWVDQVRYGVKEAVYEFCSKYHWEIIYLTMENKDHPSFAIRDLRANQNR